MNPVDKAKRAGPPRLPASLLAIARVPQVHRFWGPGKPHPPAPRAFKLQTVPVKPIESIRLYKLLRFSMWRASRGCSGRPLREAPNLCFNCGTAMRSDAFGLALLLVGLLGPWAALVALRIAVKRDMFEPSTMLRVLKAWHWITWIAGILLYIGSLTPLHLRWVYGLSMITLSIGLAIPESWLKPRLKPAKPPAFVPDL